MRYLAKENVVGMTAIYNDLKQFFPGDGSTPASEATANS